MIFCEIHACWNDTLECPKCKAGVEPYLRRREECSPARYAELKKKGLVK